MRKKVKVDSHSVILWMQSSQCWCVSVTMEWQNKFLQVRILLAKIKEWNPVIKEMTVRLIKLLNEIAYVYKNRHFFKES
jgi:hypothetical protein